VEVTDRLKGFITQEILFEDGAVAINDDTPLLDGVIDSLALMQIVGYLEEEFGVRIDDGEIIVDHFRTVADISRLVSGKLATPA
jgi:acyl carrier protein